MFNRLGRLQKKVMAKILSGECQVHDFRTSHWGHAIHDDGKAMNLEDRDTWMLHVTGMKVGDCLDRRGNTHRILRYYVHRLHRDDMIGGVSDMYKIDIEFIGAVQKNGEFANTNEEASWDGKPEFSYIPNQYSRESQIAPMRASGMADSEIGRTLGLIPPGGLR